MKLHEYQAKSILKKAGIPLPVSHLAGNAGQVKRISNEIGYPVVLKAQTLETGRGHAGGVRIVHNEGEIEDVSNEIFKLVLNQQPIQFILVEKAFTFFKEYYLGIISDLDQGTPVLRISEAGGATCLETESFNEALTLDKAIDINRGLKDYQIREVLVSLGIAPTYWKQFQVIARNLYEVYRQYDASLAEINSLVLTELDQLYALDVKINIDTQSLYRQEAFIDALDPSYFGWEEREALKYDLDYHSLPGEIGCMVNGMGLAYLTMEQLLTFNAMPAAMIDIRGGATSNSISSALEMLLTNQKVKLIIINIFGGMTSTDETSQGLLQALDKSPIKKPVFIRLEGTEATIGLDLLHKNENLSFFGNTEALVNAAISWLRGDEQ